MNSDVAFTLVQMLRNGDVYYKSIGKNLYLHCKGIDDYKGVDVCSKCTSSNLCDEISFSQDVNNNFELYEYIKQTHPELLI